MSSELRLRTRVYKDCTAAVRGRFQHRVGAYLWMHYCGQGLVQRDISQAALETAAYVTDL